MKKLLLFACLLPLCLSPRPARSCGGPAFYPFGTTLAPLNEMADGLITPIDELGDGFTIDPFLFLYPFHVDPSHQAQTEDLWNLTYSDNRAFQGGQESQPSAKQTSLEGFESALTAGNLDQAEAEARKTVETILDMPVAQANENQKDLARAVEFLEVRPFLKGAPAARIEKFFVLPAGSTELWPPEPKGIWETLSLPLALQQALIVRRAERKQYGELAKQFPQSPRAGTLGFVALQEKFAQEIPNGWAEDIRKKMTPDSWKSLEASADQWLKQFPQHPLADLAKLTQLRAFYFQEDKDRAWKLLLDLYPRRLPRVLGEMRYLVKQGLLPSDLKNPKIDPILLTAFLGAVPPESVDWTQDWNLASQNLPAAWAVNMQERLLRQFIQNKDSKTLPANFPTTASNPTPLWGQLRLMALLKADRLDEALAQAKTMPSSDQNDLLKARLYLARKEPILALNLPKLAKETKDYLLRVLSDTATLQKLCMEGEKPWKGEACLALAAREAGQGHWEQGATWLQGNDAARAALFRDAAKLSADESPTGTLAWARFLRGKQGKIFFPTDTLWYRSLNYRLDNLKSSPGTGSAPSANALPWSPAQESQAIQDYLTDETELFYALKAYAAWLKQAKPRDPEAAKVLQEADKTYNALVNRDNYNSQFWQDFLDKSEWAQTIRSAGKSIRGNS